MRANAMQRKLHPLVRIRWKAPHAVDLPLEGRRVPLDDPRLLRLLFRLAEPAGEDEIAALAGRELGVSPEAGRKWVERLVACGLLVPADFEPPELEGVGSWLHHDWLQALILHLEARGAARLAGPPGPAAPDPDDDGRGAAERADASSLALPAPFPLPAGAELERLLMRRRSHEPMVRERMSQGELASVLAQTTEIEARRRGRVEAPLDAVRVYCVAFRVEGLEPGLYRYAAETHRITPVQRRDLRAALQALSAGQPQVSAGCCAIAMTLTWSEVLREGGARRFRDAQMLLGELGHRVQLMATHAGFSTFLSSGVRSPQQAELLGFSYHDEGLGYVVAVG